MVRRSIVRAKRVYKKGELRIEYTECNYIQEDIDYVYIIDGGEYTTVDKSGEYKSWVFTDNLKIEEFKKGVERGLRQELFNKVSKYLSEAHKLVDSIMLLDRDIERIHLKNVKDGFNSNRDRDLYFKLKRVLKLELRLKRLYEKIRLNYIDI